MRLKLKKLRVYHKVAKRTKEYCSGDFYKFTIECSCGFKVHSYDIIELEDKWKEHKTEGRKTKPDNSQYIEIRKIL